jgi:hypothetical protein
VAKEGFVLLQFAPAVATRQYDWTRKQVCSSFLRLWFQLIFFFDF